ncbi:MAG: OmpA family protein [Hyphomicrobium sp.]|nr:OmpA family protein [Hyphomicrobium sp.]
MLRLAVTLILLLLMLFGGAVLLLDMQPAPLDQQAKEREKSRQEKETAKSDVDAVQEALSPAPQADGGAPTFDIARIDPNGTSVFAGRAEPNSAVTITADGKEIGTAQADGNGEWTFTTEAKIPNPDAKLALFKAPPGSASRVAEAPPTMAPGRSDAASGPAAKSAQAVTSNMIKSLEGMVAEARTAESKQAAAAAAPPPPASQAAAPGTVAPAATPPLQANIAAQPRIETTAVPVPVTFIFNEATLTSEGRRAAGLLLEYLQIKRFPKITLTGHADERGTDALNLALSAQRLQTVARFLREGGFNGRLELVPKGKSEPYTGVVRGDFSQEDLYQLDRRVELMVSR